MRSAEVRFALFYGIATWGALAAVEIAACAVKPLAVGDYDLLPPYYLKFTAILLLLYLVVGALAGTITAYLLRWLLRRRLDNSSIQVAVTLGLAVFYIINLLTRFGRWEFPHYAAALVALVISGFIVTSLATGGRPGWARVAGDPWVAAALLLGVPWVAGSPGIQKGIVLLLAVSMAGAASRIYLSRVQERSWLPRRQLLASAAAITCVLAAIPALTRDLDPAGLRAAQKPLPGTSYPNVVLIVMDTVRADHVSLYGYSQDTTPNLKAFANEATVYRRAVAVSNWTLPSHASLFTGLYPRAHGASNYPNPGDRSIVFHPLAPKHQTLAKVLSEAGYVSSAVVANIGFVRPFYGLSQGFHTFDTRVVVPWQPVGSIHYPRRLIRSLMDQFLWTLDFDRVTRRAEAITTDAISLLDQSHSRRQPLFLFVNYMDAHVPYLPPPPFDKMFPGKNPKMTRSRYDDMARNVIGTKRTITGEERAHYISQYDGAIRYMDHQIARIIRRLKELQLYDNSIIVITSDHGEAFGTRNFVGHSQSLYQNQIYLPLVIKYAGQAEPRTDDLLVSHVDLMPTIVTAAGLTAPKNIHGQNLLAGNRDPQRPVFAEAHIHSDVAALRPNHPARQYAVYRDNLKLIASSNGTHELYDLAADPAEQQDIYAANRIGVEDLQGRLTAWMDDVPTIQSPREPTDSGTIDRLKALGYVQ